MIQRGGAVALIDSTFIKSKIARYVDAGSDSFPFDKSINSFVWVVCLKLRPVFYLVSCTSGTFASLTGTVINS